MVPVEEQLAQRVRWLRIVSLEYELPATAQARSSFTDISARAARR
jgi:hypothetical protein